MRIDKLLAHAGYGTRKQVKQLIKNKHVTINGELVKNQGIHVDPSIDKITVFGEVVVYEKYTYLVLNKPQNYITATYDPFEQTVIELVPEQYAHVKLSPVGRLDKDTEGLILLTNDGKLNHKLTSPKSNIWKTYEAIVSGEVNKNHIDQFKSGFILDDNYKTKEAVLEVIDVHNGESKIKLSITEGKFHQVKRMFQSISMDVLYLKRVSIGKIKLNDDLPLGDTRRLYDEEMAWLLSIKEGD